MKFEFFIRNKGAVALLTVLMIGGVVIEISLAGLFIIYYLGQGAFGAKLSADAMAAARSGVEDAMIKIVRNKDFSSASPYNLNVDGKTAEIVVCKDSKTVVSSCDTPANNKTEITSLGKSLSKRRQLRAILSVNSQTGQVQVESIREIAL